MTAIEEGRRILAGHDRVRAHSPTFVNRRRERELRNHVIDYAGKDEQAVAARLAELEREWDIDRALMVFFAAAGTTTLQLARRRPGFRFVLQAQLGFLAAHAVLGWCPPTSLLRLLGFRTRPEIEAEKAAMRELLAELEG
jgi:hypothetical protein